MNSVIELIGKDMDRHKVAVKLPGEQTERVLRLIEITAKTRKLNDFVKAYGDQVTKTHLAMAGKIFGTEETDNVYGVFFDDEMKAVYAFNREFADYDSEKKAVVFKDIDDLLVDRISVPDQPKPTQKPKVFTPSIPPWGGGGGRVRYSLTEKGQPEN